MSAREKDSGIAYASNIGLNPRRYFGTWTPEGWRTHLIRTARPEVEALEFSRNGSRIDFAGRPPETPAPLHDPDTTSDGGIYPSVARVEHPPGRARCAVLHTFLVFPFADQTLYEQEYTWEGGRLQTHFRRHVLAEKSVADAGEGLTCATRNRPISTVISENKIYLLCNSAVWGVRHNSERKGRNYYSRQVVKRCSSHNVVYTLLKENPAPQCQGIWKLTEADGAAFSADGLCGTNGLLIGRGVPLDCPKIGLTGYALRRVPSEFHGGVVEVASEGTIMIAESMRADLRNCRDVAFHPEAVGFSASGCWDHAKHIKGVAGHSSFALVPPGNRLIFNSVSISKSGRKGVGMAGQRCAREPDGLPGGRWGWLLPLPTGFRVAEEGGFSVTMLGILLLEKIFKIWHKSSLLLGIRALLWANACRCAYLTPNYVRFSCRY